MEPTRPLEPIKDYLEEPVPCWMTTLANYGRPSTQWGMIFENIKEALYEIRRNEYEIEFMFTEEHIRVAFNKLGTMERCPEKAGIRGKVRPLFWNPREMDKVILYEEEEKKFWCYDVRKDKVNSVGHHWTHIFWPTRHFDGLDKILFG